MVNNICIRKEKAVRLYVDVIAKTFEENSEITQGGGLGGVECQWRTFNSGGSNYH